MRRYFLFFFCGAAVATVVNQKICLFQCAFISLPILTLARFILEHSLMDYATITLSDSKMASAALFMALRMVGKPGWSPTLEYYSGNSNSSAF